MNVNKNKAKFDCFMSDKDERLEKQIYIFPIFNIFNSDKCEHYKIKHILAKFHFFMSDKGECLQKNKYISKKFIKIQLFHIWGECLQK